LQESGFDIKFAQEALTQICNMSGSEEEQPPSWPQLREEKRLSEKVKNFFGIIFSLPSYSYQSTRKPSLLRTVYYIIRRLIYLNTKYHKRFWQFMFRSKNTEKKRI